MGQSAGYLPTWDIELMVRGGKHLLILTAVLFALGCGDRSDLAVEVTEPACAGAAVTPWNQSTSRLAATRLTRDREGGLWVLTNAGAGSAVVQINDAGLSKWSIAVDGVPAALATASNGDVLAATTVKGPPIDRAVRYEGTGRAQVKVTRVDISGQAIWGAIVGDGAGDLGNAFIGGTPDGGAVVSGVFTPDLSPSDFPNPPVREGGFVAKLSSSGDLLWERHFGDPDAGARGFMVDLNGRPGVILSTSSELTIDAVQFAPRLNTDSAPMVFFDTDGRAVQTFDVTESGDQRIDQVVIDGQGRLYVAGWVGHDGAVFTSELFVSAFDPSGTALWMQRFSLTNQNVDARVTVDECGDILLVGNVSGMSAGFLAARLSRDGVPKAQVTVPSSIGDRVDDVAAAPGGIFVTGAAGPNLQEGFLGRVGL
jgi:hypothetical protein